MQQFRDRDGRVWTFRVTVDVCRKVANATGYKLLELVNGETLNRFIFDIPAIVQCAYISAKTDGEKPVLAVFEDMVYGDEILIVRDMFIEALKDFFPKGHREILAGLMTLLHKTTQDARKAVTEQPPPETPQSI